MKKVIFFLSIFSLLIASVSAASIDNIIAIDNNTIELTANTDTIFSDISVEGEVKLLKDVPVSFSAIDTENAKKVLLNLSVDLTANRSYSLITIIGAEGNIDFTIGNFLEGEIINTNLVSGDIGLEKINIVDSRTIELYFTNDLTSDTFEFKILSDININSLKSEGNNILSLEVANNLEKSTSYIIMILSLEDAMGNVLNFDEDLLEFTTPIDLVEDIPEEEVIIAAEEEIPEVIEEGNIEEVALNSAKTPATGTATSVLIAIALIINLAFFLRKKILNNK